MQRGIIAVALICAFVVLAAYYQANVTQHLDYPRESDLNANYARYIGLNVVLTGRVVTTGAQSFELQGMSRTYTILSSAAVRPGVVVTVVGTLEPGHQLRAATIYAPSARELAVSRLLSALGYVRSFIAFVFVAVLFFMGWRFDRRRWVIRPREADGERTPKQGGA